MSYLMKTYKKSDFTIVSGKNSKVFDSEGNEYLDFTSGIGVNSLGYANDKILDALKKQSAKLMHISNLFATENDEILAEMLCKKTGMENVFFANSGAEANEGAIKLARKYSFDKYGEGRYEIITLKDSFHGRTLTTLKATGQDKFHKYFMPFIDGFSYASPTDLEDVKAKVTEKTCAIMLEVVQGEGGVLPLKKEFLEGVQKICTENDILLIIDEVQTGIGRTGKFAAFSHYDIKPDILTFAKGLGGGIPIGAVLAGEKCKDTFSYSDHGSTFGGNPLCTAVGIEVVSTLDDKFLESLECKGKYLLQKLENIESPFIKDIRGLGLMVGIEIKDKLNTDIYAKCKELGVLVLTAGNNTVRLLPPLNISFDEINTCVEVLKKALV